MLEVASEDLHEPAVVTGNSEVRKTGDCRCWIVVYARGWNGSRSGCVSNVGREKCWDVGMGGAVRVKSEGGKIGEKVRKRQAEVRDREKKNARPRYRGES
jgi:hypothetical protein